MKTVRAMISSWRALVRSINRAEYPVTLTLIGGGTGCQLLERDFLKGLFDAYGLKMLPDEAFKVANKKEDWLYIDWMDTKESQEVLQFQTETFQQFENRVKHQFRWRRLGIKIISPIAKLFLLRMSPYFKS